MDEQCVPYTAEQKKVVINSGFEMLKNLLKSEAIPNLVIDVCLGNVYDWELLETYYKTLWLTSKGLELRGPGVIRDLVERPTKKLVEACRLNSVMLSEVLEKIEA